jgi:protein TonB
MCWLRRHPAKRPRLLLPRPGHCRYNCNSHSHQDSRSKETSRQEAGSQQATKPVDSASHHQAIATHAAQSQAGQSRPVRRAVINQMARSTQPTTTSANGQVAVTAGARGFNYPYYVENIQRKVFSEYQFGRSRPTHTQGRTVLTSCSPSGAMARPTDVKLDKSSGSPTLDQACIRAARRVDTFGPLPSPPGDGNLTVSYYCEY